jgi:hypothetical protein
MTDLRCTVRISFTLNTKAESYRRITLVDSDPWKPSETKSVPAKSKRNLYHVEATPPPGIADRAEPRKPCQIKAWARGRMCNPGFEHGRGAP